MVHEAYLAPPFECVGTRQNDDTEKISDGLRPVWACSAQGFSLVDNWVYPYATLCWF